MAASANATIESRAAERTSFDVAASTHLYEAQLAFVDSNGRATGSTNSGANQFGGIVIEEQDNSAGAAGDLVVETYICGAFKLTGAGFSADDVGKPVFASDSNTITLNAEGNVYIGEIIEYVSATVVWVRLDIGTFRQYLPLGDEQSLSGAGAVNVTSYLTKVSTTGANALTLADGSRPGQLKKIQMIVDAGDGTLTPTNFSDGTTITFADVGDYVVLVWTGTTWKLVESGNAADGVSAPAVA